MQLLLDISQFILALCGIWLGSGVIVNSVERLAKGWKLSPFVISFFLLGMITSLSEVSLAVNSYFAGEQEVSVGNLIGGMIVLFLLVIPLLGVLGKGIILNHDLNRKNLLLCIIVLLAPSLLLIDKNVSVGEGLLVVLLYGGTGYRLFREETRMEKLRSFFSEKKEEGGGKQILRIIGGGALLIVACNILVRETVLFAETVKVSPFIVSLLMLSIGTNLPEITLTVRSILKGDKDVAFGNYVGSATFNSLIFGLLAIASGGISIQADFLKVFTSLATGLLVFYFFSRSNNELSRYESSVLLGMYVIFLAYELASV